jgi:hypothetical protein
MASLDSCFVDQVIEPVQLVEVGQVSQQSATSSHQLQFSTVQELTTHLDNVQNNNYTCRYMSVALGLPELKLGDYR